MEEAGGFAQQGKGELLAIMLRGVVPVATRRPHLYIFLVQVLVGLTYQILVIVKDLWLLEATMLFLEGLHLGKVLGATTATHTLA